MKHAVILLELILLASAYSSSAQLEDLNAPSESDKSGPHVNNLPEFKRASHQRNLQIHVSQLPNRNKCPRFCQEQGQQPSDFQFCTSYCEPCIYVGFEEDLCVQISEEYEELTNSTPPWLISTLDDDNKASLCPLYFTPGKYWYSSDPFLNLQHVRIISFYKNTFAENQIIVGESFQIWTQNRMRNSNVYLPPVTYEEEVDGLVVEPGQSIKVVKTIDLSNAPTFHDTISMRVYTVSRGFAPLGFNLTSTQITCFDGPEEEETASQRQPTIVCPNNFAAAPWGFDTDPPFQNIRAIEISADYQNQLNQSQTILSNKFQVWTASTRKENYDLPPLIFNPNPGGWVVEPGEIVTISLTVDLRDTPAYHSIVSMKLFTLESGPTLPGGMEIVSSTIVCLS